MLNPSPAGTEIRITISHGSEMFTALGKVIFVSPNTFVTSYAFSALQHRFRDTRIRHQESEYNIFQFSGSRRRSSMKFDLDLLISDCRKAVKESAPQPAINEILARGDPKTLSGK
jgi:hypothetical protein